MWKPDRDLPCRTSVLISPRRLLRDCAGADGTRCRQTARSGAAGTPSATAAAVPPSPTTVTAVPASSTAIELDWTDVPEETDTGSSGSPDGSTGWVTVATTGQDVTTYLDGGLASDTTYQYPV
jgi:hypothetical protein